MRLDQGSLRRLITVTTALIGLNLLMVGGVLIGDCGGGGAERRGSAEVVRPASAPGEAPELLARAGSPPSTRSTDPVESFLLSTIEPLRAAATDLEREIELPTDAALAACVEAGDLGAGACTGPLATLRSGYELVGMPFPTAPALPIGEGEAAPPGEAVASGGSAAGSEVLQVYFDTLQARLRTAAEAAGDDLDGVLPDPTQVAAAVATGDPRSEASGVVLDHLRDQHARYGLRFTEPYVSGEGAAPPAPASAVAGERAQPELLASYLDHMIRRLERAAEDQHKDAEGMKPSAAAVAAAVATGAVDSAETQAVLATLREGYATLDLEFAEPPL